MWEGFECGRALNVGGLRMWEGPGLWEGPECERALNVGGPCQETEEDLW